MLNWYIFWLLLQDYGFVPQTYILPYDFKLLKRAWDDGSTRQKWILKPVRNHFLKTLIEYAHDMYISLYFGYSLVLPVVSFIFRDMSTKGIPYLLYNFLGSLGLTVTNF